MKRLKALIISMMIVLLSVILLSETQATNSVVEKESLQSANRFEEGILSNHLDLCFLRFCDTSYGEILEPCVFPVNGHGSYRVELAQTGTGW